MDSQRLSKLSRADMSASKDEILSIKYFLNQPARNYGDVMMEGAHRTSESEH
jgi:hypothetical protein